MPEFRLTPAAESDLEEIYKHTEQQWGADQADRYLDQITDTFSALARMPQAAPSCDYIQSGYRRRAIASHVVYFRLTDYGIAIIRILHERMSVKQNLSAKKTQKKRTMPKT